MLFIINTLAPIGLLIVLGAGLRRFGFAGEELFRQMNRFVYWILLPSLLFLKTAQAPVDIRSVARIVMLLIAAMLVSILIGFIASALTRLRGPRRAALVQGSYRGNLAFIGLPVILFASAAANGEASEQTQALAVLALAPMVPLYNLCAVPILLAGAPHRSLRSKTDWLHLIGKVGSNPLIIACVAGLAFSFAHGRLPRLLVRPLGLLGQAALPLALVSIGSTIRIGGIARLAGPTLLGALIKTVAGPLVCILLARLLPVSDREFSIALLYLAAPTAVSSYIMAQQLGADEQLAANIIAASTLLALPVLVAALSMVHGL
jgi:hypothetical protein